MKHRKNTDKNARQRRLDALRLDGIALEREAISDRAPDNEILLADGLGARVDTSKPDRVKVQIQHHRTGRRFSLTIIPDEDIGALVGFDYGNLKAKDREELEEIIPFFIKKVLTLLRIVDTGRHTARVAESHNELSLFMGA